MISNRKIIEYAAVSLALSLAWSIFNAQTLIVFLQIAVYLCLASLLIFTVLRFRTKKTAKKRLRPATTARKLREWLLAVNMSLLVSLLAYAYLLSAATLQMTRIGYTWNVILVVGVSLGAWVFFILTRQQHIRYSIQLVALVIVCGLSLEVWKAHSDPEPSKTLVLGPLLKEPFFVLNGGPSRLLNSSLAREPARHIYAFVISETKYAEAGTKTRDERVSLSFGKPVLAPLNGIVHEVVSDLPDRTEEVNFNHPLGNYVALKSSEDRYVFLTNLKQHSVTLKAGDTIHAGQIIGQIGWSGMVTECMLAMIVMDGPDIFSKKTKSFPVYLEGVIQPGDASRRKLHFPRRNDLFTPLPLAP
jgi:hypothetical protein